MWTCQQSSHIKSQLLCSATYYPLGNASCRYFCEYPALFPLPAVLKLISAMAPKPLKWTKLIFNRLLKALLGGKVQGLFTNTCLTYKINKWQESIKTLMCNYTFCSNWKHLKWSNALLLFSIKTREILILLTLSCPRGSPLSSKIVWR